MNPPLIVQGTIIVRRTCFITSKEALCETSYRAGLPIICRDGEREMENTGKGDSNKLAPIVAQNCRAKIGDQGR